MTWNEFRRVYAQKLSVCSAEDSGFESDCIAAEILGCKNSSLVLYRNEEVTAQQLEKANAIVARRLNGEPLQYIFGKWEFCGNEFFVGEGVLIPRSETELLFYYARLFLRNRKSALCLDLCSGSGCIGISVAKAMPNVRCLLLEKSPQAFEYLKKNIEANRTANASAMLCDVLQKPDITEKADLILSNPPYIKSDEIAALQREVGFEPKMALDGGCDGLTFYRAIAENWVELLKPDGTLAVEIGDEQGEAVKAIFSQYFEEVEIQKDFSHHDRVVTAAKKK